MDQLETADNPDELLSICSFHLEGEAVFPSKPAIRGLGQVQGSHLV